MLQQTIAKKSTPSSIRGGIEEYTFADVHELAAFVAGEIRASKLKYARIAERAGVCASTVSKLAYGETHSPRANTVLQILLVLGFEIVARRR